jgi:dTDP-4-dehydrorhamnose reductase
MKLWGGIECSLNRVRGVRFDQLARNGHYTRGDDLERIAALGIRTLRYPLLWERAATASPEEYDWTFADERLAQMRTLGIEPIAGLVHHGCGPDHTDLLAENFATGLAHYAGRLAARFPWVEWYTPVNEPLTTARFSGLYGLWHPHASDARSFARMLINECRATVLAMQAIREVNPQAKLMQTDDLGTTYSTQKLAYQANFENHRRWLAWDLLCGRVGWRHPLYAYLRRSGISADTLAWFVDNPCPPAIIGIDHYVTSDRFLDEDLARYPRCHWGGNDGEPYADINAVRVLDTPGTSLRELICEAAQRYGLPVALAEVHIGCTPDEQLRWLHDAWTTCLELEAQGVDVRAATAWAMLGSYDWNSLLTANAGTYEPGVFAVVDGALERTPLTSMVEELARNGRCQNGPCGKGWWLRDERLIYEPRCLATSIETFFEPRQARSAPGS